MLPGMARRRYAKERNHSGAPISPLQSPGNGDPGMIEAFSPFVIFADSISTAFATPRVFL